jgi:hypothetical protein
MRLNKAKTKTNETKPTLQEAFQQRGRIHNHQLTTMQEIQRGTS